MTKRLLIRVVAGVLLAEGLAFSAVEWLHREFTVGVMSGPMPWVFIGLLGALAGLIISWGTGRRPDVRDDR